MQQKFLKWSENGFDAYNDLNEDFSSRAVRIFVIFVSWIFFDFIINDNSKAFINSSLSL